MAEAALWAGGGLGIAGVALLRYAWSLPHRSMGWNGAGWGVLVVAMVCGALGGGAWGVSVEALVTTAAAFGMLAAAALATPSGRAKASDRRVRMLPQPGEPRRIGRRVATFLIVIPGAAAATLALALATRGLVGLIGGGEANANVAALYMVPLGWALLAVVLLMQERRRSQLVTLLGCAVVSAPLVLVGAAA